MMPSIVTTTSPNSLGPTVLKDLVVQAASHDTSTSLDLKGIVWLEHINLVVGSKPLAQRFYLDILGCSADKSKSFHCNLGQQQFHLAETGDPAQRVSGSIGLVVPSVARVHDRVQQALQESGGEFGDTFLKIVEYSPDAGMLSLLCPWGNRLHLYDATMDEESLQPASESPHKMVKLHEKGGTYATHRMAIRGNPGIRYLEIVCPPKTTPAIAQFYQDLMGCTVSPTLSSTSTPAIAVCVGPGVHLVYVETETSDDYYSDKMQGVHICIYVNDFQGLYERLKTRDLIWTNPRFTHLDSCDTWEEAMASRTLRFKDIIDLETGDKVLEFEHETRPMRHGQFLKVPFYEPK